MRLSGLLITVQASIWVILGTLADRFSPRLDHILEVFWSAYWPTINAVQLRGNYKGAASFFYPIFYGVLIGIPIYGIVGAAAVCLIKRRK